MHMVGRDDLTIKAKISGGAGITGNSAFKAEIKGCPDRGINTHTGHHAAEQELGDVCRFQVIKQIGFPEAVGVVLGDYCLISKRQNSVVDIYSRRIWQKEC